MLLCSFKFRHSQAFPQRETGFRKYDRCCGIGFLRRDAPSFSPPMAILSFALSLLRNIADAIEKERMSSKVIGPLDTSGLQMFLDLRKDHPFPHPIGCQERENIRPSPKAFTTVTIGAHGECRERFARGSFRKDARHCSNTFPNGLGVFITHTVPCTHQEGAVNRSGFRSRNQRSFCRARFPPFSCSQPYKIQNKRIFCFAESIKQFVD